MNNKWITQRAALNRKNLLYRPCLQGIRAEAVHSLCWKDDQLAPLYQRGSALQEHWVRVLLIYGKYFCLLGGGIVHLVNQLSFYFSPSHRLTRTRASMPSSLAISS